MNKNINQQAFFVVFLCNVLTELTQRDVFDEDDWEYIFGLGEDVVSVEDRCRLYEIIFNKRPGSIGND